MNHKINMKCGRLIFASKLESLVLLIESPKIKSTNLRRDMYFQNSKNKNGNKL